MTDLIRYEFPLTKPFRLFLRFEQLMAQFDAYVQQDSQPDTLAAVITLSDIYQLTMHVDLKSEVLRESERQANILRARGIPEHELAVFDECQEIANGMTGQLGSHLKNHYLFNLIRQRLAMPGGINPFDLPVTHYWFNQPFDDRQKVLLRWILPYFQINKAITRLLAKIRDLGKPEDNIARQGYFQYNLPPSNNYQLLQIEVPARLKSYPEISSGRQRISLRFFDLQDPSQRAGQTSDDVEFRLCLCG